MPPRAARPSSVPAPALVVAPGARAAEAWLLGALEAERAAVRGDPRLLALPVRIVVPSQSLRDHLCASLVRSLGATAGVEVATLHALALEILSNLELPRPAGERLFPVAVRQAAREEPELRAELEGLEDGYGAVVAAVSDLFDAGFEPVHADALDERLAGLDGAAVTRTRALLRVATRVAERLAAHGAGHRSELLRRARAGLEADPERALAARAVFVHGFAEATGVASDLLEALVRLRAARVVIDHPPDPTHGEGTTSDPLFTRRLRERLAPLAPLHVPPLPAATPDRIELLRAAGAEGEARAAARRIRRLLDDGATPERIGVVARDLAPYAAPLRRHLSRLAVPFSGAGGTPAPGGAEARQVAALLALLGQGPGVTAERWTVALAEPPAGAATLRLALHALGAARLADVARLEPDADVPLPVRHGLGVAEEEGAEPRAPRRKLRREAFAWLVRRARQAVEQLGAWPAEAPLREHAERLQAFAAEALGWRDASPGAAALERGLEVLVGPSAPSGMRLLREDFLLLLRRELEAAAQLPLGGAGAGVALLGVMEARGRSFEQLFVLGLGRDVFPRAASEDPLLPDGLRRALAAELLPDLPIKGLAHQEERYLFEQLLSAAPRVTLSCQAASDEGRRRAPSPFFEALRRGRGLEAPLEPTLASPLAPAGPLPAHEHALRAGLHAGRQRFEAILPVALAEAQGARPAEARTLRPERLARARCAVLAELDPLRRPGRLGPYYGFVGAPREPADPRHRKVYVTTVERMADCGWYAFLMRLLQLAPVPDALEALPGADPLLVGAVVHRTLEAIVARALGTRPASLAEVAARAPVAVPWPEREALDALLGEAVRAELRESGIALAGFERLAAELARPLLERAYDLDWEPEPPQVLGAEVEGAVALGDREIHFKADRVDRAAGRLRLTDYKTGRPVSDAKRADTRMRHLLRDLARGKRLQPAAYAQGAGPGSEGRLLFLGPGLEAEAARCTIEGEDPEAAAAFRSAAGVALRAFEAGSFPPRLVETAERKTPGLCERCEVLEACLQYDTTARHRLAEWMERAPADGSPPAEAAAAALHGLREAPAPAEEPEP